MRTVVFFTFSILFSLLETSYCEPLACGNIRNISYPFKLADVSRSDHYGRYELVCENNSTLLFYSTLFHKYRVQSINYHNHTIRLVDDSVDENDTCSLPQYSQNERDFVHGYHYSYHNRSSRRGMLLAWPITFLSCPYPVNYSSYIEYDGCVKRDNNSNNRYTYVKVGHLNASDVGDKCTIDLIVMTSMSFKDNNNFTNLEMHLSLVYGFEVSWFNALCDKTCREGQYCQWDESFTRTQCSQGYVAWALKSASIIASLMFLGAKHVIGVPILLGLLIYKLRRRHMSIFDVIEHFLLHHNNLVPIRYSYSEIKKMAKGFQEKIGKGGYGTVYKGKLRSGHDVAVKVLNTESRSNGQDFMNEVATLGRIHHVNVVKLVGYCAEGSKCALIYDFMPKGSLDKYILKQDTSFSLNWERKHHIAVGVARGIEYLHRGCEVQILHFDIKPHNILLDDNFTPKISDFGLAKFFSTEKDIVTLTAARGTIGYVAPELIHRSIGGVSYKADVYSFGMLLMEMVGLKRDLGHNGESSSQYFPFWIYNYLEQQKDVETGNADDGIDDVDAKITRKMAIVALWCIQMSPGDRPTMGKVLEMLEEDDVISLQIPPQPTCSPQVFEPTWETYTTDSISLAV